MDLDPGTLESALETLGAVLLERGRPYELVAIGGSSLMLLGLLARPTKDLDIVARVQDGRYVQADPLPPELLEAANDVGHTLGLGEEWLNPGPSSLLDLGLPPGFDERAETRRFGALVLRIAGRRDQIFLKLYAAVDQGLRSKHADDLRRLEPTHEDLIEAAHWAQTHDPSTGFRDELVRTLEAFGVVDGDAEV